VSDETPLIAPYDPLPADVPPPAHLAPAPVKAPIEHKVTSSALGGGGGAIVAAFIIWALSECVFHEPAPFPVQAFILWTVTVAGAMWRGWAAPHTPRPDLTSGR
jgi:hypothetical protein